MQRAGFSSFSWVFFAVATVCAWPSRGGAAQDLVAPGGNAEAGAQPEHFLSGLYLFGGVATGGTYLFSQNSTEVAKRGFHVLLSGLLSVRAKMWDYDVAGSWLYNRLYSSKGEQVKSSALGDIYEQKDVNIRSRTGLLSAAARYDVGKNWRVGPSVSYILDNSVAFTQVPASKSARFLAGVSSARDLSFERFPYVRATCDLQTDLNIEKRQILFFNVGIQIGVGVSHLVKKESTQDGAAAKQPSVRVVLDSQGINFDTAQWTLEPSLEKFVRGMAKFLKTNDTYWKSVTVEGHTDSRGNWDKNIELSRKRANAIQNIFLSEGVPANKVSIVGYGAKIPAVTPEVTLEDFRKNRRVIFVFNGVSDSTALNAEITRLRQELLNSQP